MALVSQATARLRAVNRVPIGWVLATPESCPQPQLLPLLEKGISVSEKPLLAQLCKLWICSLFPSLLLAQCIWQIVFATCGFGAWLFPSLTVDGVFFSFSSFIYFSVDQRGGAYMCLAFFYW